MFVVPLVLSLFLASPSAEADSYRWIESSTDPGRLYLYRAGVQVGGYDLIEHYYRPYDGKSWGAPCDPPFAPPCFGVTPGKVGAGPMYRLNGQPITANAAYEVVEKGLDDDGQKLRVSIIGPTAVRTKARAELEKHAGFAELRDRLAIRDFPPGHWALKAGFVTTGQPTIYCQAPEGQVLHRQDDFAGGADALVTALRGARDSYNPRRDPDLRSQLANLPRYLSFAGVAGAGLYAGVRLRRRTGL